MLWWTPAPRSPPRTWEEGSCGGSREWRDAPANRNANEGNREQEVDNEGGEEEGREDKEEEKQEEKGDGEIEDTDED